MHRYVEVYAERPEPLPGDERWSSGSGYLLATRLVLTAAHPVCRGHDPLPKVLVRDGDGALRDAVVVWHRPEPQVDVALLKVTDPHWSSPRWRRQVRFGRFVTGQQGQACEAVGYPKVVAAPELRDSHQATGSISPKSLVKAGLYAMEVSNPPCGPSAAGSEWAGMSGAGVVCAGLLVGVVTTDPAGFDSRRLVTTPIAAIAGDPSFAGLVRDHTGSSPVLEPVELTGLAHRAEPPTSPADLLRADAAAAPFRDRPELGQLLSWCEDPAWTSVRLVVGPGGQGKSRLAQQLITSLTQGAAAAGQTGWAALVLADHADLTGAAVLADVTSPILVVVDYAEGRSTTLGPLFAAASQAESKMRLLLLARNAGPWRTERVEPARHMESLADDRIVLPLHSLEPDAAGREKAWREAISAYASRLGELDGYHHLPWPELQQQLDPPNVAAERFPTVLSLQMDALAALMRAADFTPNTKHPQAGDAEGVLLSHEQRYWTRVAHQHGVTLSPSTQRCLVAMATLWGAGTPTEARQLVAAVLGRPDDDDAVVSTATWLATLYQTVDNYWTGLQPDLLGEHLVASTLGPSGDCPDMVARTRVRATTAQMARGLTVLGRAHQHHPELHETIADTVLSAGPVGALAATTVALQLSEPEPLLTAVEEVARTADLEGLGELNDGLPRFSLLLGPAALTVAFTMVQRLREAAEGNRDAYLPDLAVSVNNLAVRLAEAGRRAEGLAAAQEAVDLRRELAEGNRDAYLPDLAMSVNNLAVRLAETGRRAEGLAAAQEAVDLRRELAEGNRDAYLPDLAMSVNNLAVRLAETGRRAEGLAAAQEAVDLRRELAEGNRDAYLPDLAMSVNNLAIRLAETGRRAEGLAAAQEAVDLYRELAEGNRDAYLPDLAMSVNNLAIRLAETGRRAEGLAAAQEAVDLYRELAEGNRDAYLPDLAASVNNLAIRLAETGRRAEGLAAAQEAVDLYRELAEGNRDAYLPDLAMSVNNLAVRLAETGRRAEGLAAAQEAVDLCRELAEGNRDAYLPDLAMSVNNLAIRLAETGRRAEGLAAAQEAVDLRRELAEGNRDAYLPDLAMSVNNLAIRLAETGRRAEGLAAAQEAVDLYRELAEGNRDVFGPALDAARDLVVNFSRLE